MLFRSLVLAAFGSTMSAEVKKAWQAPAADPRLITAIALIYLQLLLVTAIALFFSTFSTPFLSIVLTLGLWAIGTGSAELRNADSMLASGDRFYLLRALYYVLPNIAAFDIKNQVVHAIAVPWRYVVSTAAYGVVYTAFVLTAATVVFGRREFK